GGGVHRYTIRGYTPFAKGKSLSVDSSYSMNNLDGSMAETIRRENVNVGYAWNPGPAFSFNTTYQCDKFFQITDESATNKVTNNLLFYLTAIVEKSTLQTSLTLGRTRESASGQSTSQSAFSGAWTLPVGPPLESARPVMSKPRGPQPIGGLNLIPTVNWTFQKPADGGKIEVEEFRVTVDGQLFPEASRSSLGLYRKISENTQDQIVETWTGVSATIYLKPWGNSNLTFTYNYSWHTKDNADGFIVGSGQSCSLIWKSFF
ncbi:MAG TPA: hypothetical protein VHY08_22955, partial [Bacillota bacterium]|nr:hypothetical protein [Bacillota bacterium]